MHNCHESVVFVLQLHLEDDEGWRLNITEENQRNVGIAKANK